VAKGFVVSLSLRQLHKVTGLEEAGLFSPLIASGMAGLLLVW